MAITESTSLKGQDPGEEKGEGNMEKLDFDSFFLCLEGSKP